MKSFSWSAVTVLLILGWSNPARSDISPVASEAIWQATIAPATLLDFESFSGPVGNTYLGLGAAFSNLNTGIPTFWVGAGLNSAQSLYTKTFVGEGGGGFSMTFANPQGGVAFWSLDVEFAGSTVSFFDSSDNLLESFDVQGSGTGHGEFVYGFNGYISDFTDIARMDLAINADDAIWFDNVQFGVSSVPEPAISSLALFSLLALRLRTRRAR